MRLLRNVKYLMFGFGAAGGSAAALLWNYEDKNRNFPYGFEHYPSYLGNMPNNVKIPWDTNWDKRSPEVCASQMTLNVNKTDENNNKLESDVKKPKATRHLFLIRHGQYEMKPTRAEDRRLTVLGRQQAEVTGQRLKDLGYPFTALISSSMIRAVETAGIISKFIPHVPYEEKCTLLEEGAPIQPEPAVHHWRPDVSFYEDGPRIEAAFRKYFHRAEPEQAEDSYEIIVCHANVIRYFVCRALQFPPEGWLRMGLHNASITWVSIRPSGYVSLHSLGDAGHIPPEKLSTS